MTIGHLALLGAYEREVGSISKKSSKKRKKHRHTHTSDFKDSSEIQYGLGLAVTKHGSGMGPEVYTDGPKVWLVVL